jgi:LPXTG-motif cell wall-anchored protein
VKKIMYINKLIKFALFLLILFLIFPFGNTFAMQTLGEIDIATTPEKVLFNVKDFKPGDWAIRTLKIKNSGKEDFKYLASAKLKSGSEKLYNELLLTINDSNKEIFSGKLSDFKKLEPRLLNQAEQEELVFNVKFPYELSNEFQGLASIVEFKFYAEGTLGGVLPVDGPKLPNTGSNMFNILLAGAVLVLGGTILQFFLKRRNRLDRHS